MTLRNPRDSLRGKSAKGLIDEYIPSAKDPLFSFFFPLFFPLPAFSAEIEAFKQAYLECLGELRLNMTEAFIDNLSAFSVELQPAEVREVAIQESA